MTHEQPVRVGFIGAGGICRSRHLPGLKKIAGVQVVAVANRTLESSRAVANEFGIEHVVSDWRALLRRSDLDAIFIGTWPYMHMEMSIAALQAGKHVFCQARMAMDQAQARKMLDAAKAHPQLVNMVCPPPHRFPYEPYFQHVIQSGQLGPITLVQLASVSAGNLSLDKVTWREKAELSGKQVLAMGIHAETLQALLGDYEYLSACTSIPLPNKTDAGKPTSINIPQVVTITGRLAQGILAVEHHMGLAVDASTPGDQLTIWGLRGTLRYRFGNHPPELAAPGKPFEPVAVPAHLTKPWRVEEDFISAVRAAQRGEHWSVSPDFAEAYRYMRKVEAVHRAQQTGQAVRLSDWP